MSDRGPARPGRAIGIDLGSRRIGIAVSDSEGRVALPRGVVERSGDAARDRRALVELAVEERAVVVVVGLPRSMDGRDGPAAQAALAEADALATELVVHGVAVELFDERLTTVSAQRALVDAGGSSRQRRKRIDETAAAVMLSAWLDRPGTST